MMEYEACFGPSAMPMGTGTCEDFFECFTSCPEGDRDCINGCIEATSPEGYADYEAVIQCGQDNSCFNEDGSGNQACFDMNCAEEQVPCFGEPITPNGDGDCIALTQCLEACEDPTDRETCARPCIEAASQAGYDARIALDTCLMNSTDANGAPCQDIACAQAACATEAAACYPDGMIPAPTM